MEILMKILNTLIDFGVGSLSADSTKFNGISFDISRITGNEGIIFTAVAYSVVFLSLVILYLFIRNMTKVVYLKRFLKLKKSGKDNIAQEDLNIPGETNAAIAAALYYYFSEIHDFENTVLTIKKVQRAYSPWSSKIYGITENPKK